MWDLNGLIPDNSGWLLTYAFGINDNLWITGEGQLNGRRRGFLLIPAGADTSAGNTTALRAFLYTPVPEPSTFALAGVPVVIGVIRRWRR
jgi:hypothetical protein